MILIKNGTIVTIEDIFKGDILLENEKISAIGEHLSCPDATILDAQGKYVFPGGIDVHTHMALPFLGTVSADNFEDGSKAAAFGGITTIIDFALQNKGQSLKEALELRKNEAKDVCIDYGLHLSLTDLSGGFMEEMREVIAQGCPTFKLFMTYPNLAVDDYTLFHAIKTAGENNGMISVHAENLHMIERNIKKLLEEGHITPEYHAISRPDYIEAEAVSRACTWAEETGGRLYIVHLSSKKGLDRIRESRLRGGKIYAETCPQYLLLTEECYKAADFGGAKYVMSPPLRKNPDSTALWQGISSGDIQVVGSDHCPFNMEQKKLGLTSFAQIPNGGPGVETSMMLLYSEGVLKNKISLNQLVKVLSYNPAKLFGLKNKGSLQPGKDADVVLFNPHKKRILSKDTLHSKIDYSIYDGYEITGVPDTTILRGRILCQDGDFIGEKGYGNYLKRRLAD